MELTTSWKEEGKAEGERQLILRQLRKRFGALDTGWEVHSSQLSFEQLGELGEAFVDFKSPADVKTWLDAH